jgi:nucleotide-binding universal stress UspA family protein
MSEAKGQVVVVGVDFEAGGDEAILSGLRMLASGAAQELHLLHVLDPRDVISGPESPALETEERVLAEAPGILRDRARALAEQAHVTYEPERLATHARIGRAVATLLQMTVDYDADLLVVGTHGRRGLSHVMLGSVAEELVRGAHCPVLVARAKDYAGLLHTKLPDPPSSEPKKPKSHAIDPTEHTVSTESDIWDPSGSQPTGFRIV